MMSRHAQANCLLVLLVVVCTTVCQAQSQLNVEPPSTATTPLYVCKMEVSELPEYDGIPTPDMQAAAIGLSQALDGMLAPWFIDDTFPVSDSTSAQSTNKGAAGSTASPPQAGSAGNRASAGRGDSSSSSGRKLNPPKGSSGTNAGKGSSKPNSGREQKAPPPKAKQPPSSSSGQANSQPEGAGRVGFAPPPGGVTAQPVLPPSWTLPPAFSAPPAAGTPPPTYIVPRPALASLREGQVEVATAAIDEDTAAAAAEAAAASAAAAAATLSAPPVAAAAAAPAASPSLSIDPSLAAAAKEAATGVNGGQGGTTAVVGGAGVAAQGSTAAPEVAEAVLSGSPAEQGSAASATAANLASSTTPSRHLLQVDVPPGREVCNKGTPTVSSPPPFIKKSFNATYGEVGISMGQTNVIPPDPTLAVGPINAIHIVNSLVRIIPLTTSGTIKTNPRPGEGRLIPLPDFFGLVASPCIGGYIYPAAVFDKEVGRFLFTAICGGDSNMVLLAASTTASALGAWILFSFAGEVTQSTPLVCPGYPVSLQSRITYNTDGVYITYVQNCPDNQETATGAILFALPKWAVYKGSTFFYVPVWTAWDIYNATGQLNTEALYPGAFLQLEPVIPQRREDVQAEVVYFVMDNLNYVFPLQRTEFTVVALINTGSLWLYEGPTSNSPSPLLVSRVVGRGVSCLAVPNTKMPQPIQISDAFPETPLPSPQQCYPLDAGAMRPPGFWDGGAALFANQIYLADRGPDIISQILDPTNGGNFTLPTIYWAVVTPSFCVSGPCAPWFGSDWGWSNGWDWNTGSWQEKSERAKNPYSDPAFYNQVFLFPGPSGQTKPVSFNNGINGRKLQAAASPVPAAGTASVRYNQANAAESGSARQGSSSQGNTNTAGSRSSSVPQQPAGSTSGAVARDGVGVPITSTPNFRGSVTAAALLSKMGPIKTREAMLAAVRAALDHMEAMKPSAESKARPYVAYMDNGYNAYPGGTSGDLGSSTGNTAFVAIASMQSGEPVVFIPSVNGENSSSAGGSSNTSYDRGISITAGRTADRGSGGGSGSTDGQASASFFGGSSSIGGFAWQGFNGWGNNDITGPYYFSYYQFWREYYFMRNLYMNLRIPPKVNPCKYYKDWAADNDITFGAIVTRRGVLEYVTNQANPVGVAYPQVAVVGGSMLVVYSFSGPLGIPDSNGFPLAYPGVAYSFIPPDGANGNFAIRYAKVPGAELNPQCIQQHGLPYWGAYSGIDIHYPSQKVISAVESSWGSNKSANLNSNAATWLSVFS